MNEQRNNRTSSIQQEAEPLTWMFWRKRRYIVVLLAFLGYVSSYTLRVNISVAIVAMTENRTVHYEDGTVAYERSFNWTSQERGMILSSFYWGYIMTQFAGGIFAKRFGGNVIFGVGIGLTAILSLLTPWLGKTVTAMVVIRVMQGLFGGVTFPCIHNIWFYWAPKPERSRMTSLAYAGMFIGTVVTMPSSAHLATLLGWESTFYVFGGAGVLWYIVWVIIVRSSPDRDPFTSNDELRYIQSNVDVEKEDRKIVPWKALLTSGPVYAITIAQFSLNWSDNTMLTQMPTFLAEALNYNLGNSGFLSAAPYLAKGILISLAGYLADMSINRRTLTITQTRKILICGAAVVLTICMTFTGFLVHPVWSVVLIIVGGLDIAKSRALELAIRYVNNHWKSLTEDEVELSVLSGGFSSRVYLMEDRSFKLNPTKKFLIRLYGGKMLTENDPIKPEGGEIKETLVFYAVGLAGLGPKLHGSFEGGRVEEFIPSHMLQELDYIERPETLLELARKLARYHSLDLPISKERHRILDACELLYEQRDFEEFRKLANHLGIADISICEKFDIKSEIAWLKKVENVVNGRIVTISGDLNKNNILIRDEPDKFGERVMMIDYELTTRDYRGRDLGQLFVFKVFEMVDGFFSISGDYPEENWRRSLITEYLNETKKLNYFEWDEKLDNVDHVLMEADFFMFHSIQMVCGFFFNQKGDSLFYKMPTDKARSMLALTTYMIELYQKRKAIFIETYGQVLNY